MGLKIGDVVRLKTGGPAMTVTGLFDADHQATCQWFIEREMIDTMTTFNASAPPMKLTRTEWIGPRKAEFGVDALDVVEVAK